MKNAPKWHGYILLISPDEAEWVMLQRVLNGTDWQMDRVSNFREALAFIRAKETAVALCHSRLEDGDWRDFIKQVDRLTHPPKVVVLSELADVYLWAETLEHGCYDLLSVPLKAEEAAQTVRFAYTSWHLDLKPRHTVGAA